MWGHTGVHMFMCNYAKGMEEVGSHVDMHTFTNVPTVSNLIMGPDEGWLGYTLGTTQWQISIPLCKWGGEDVGN